MSSPYGEFVLSIYVVVGLVLVFLATFLLIRHDLRIKRYRAEKEAEAHKTSADSEVRFFQDFDVVEEVIYVVLAFARRTAVNILPATRWLLS